MADFHILLVDDDELSRELITLFLEAEGDRITTLPSAEQAIQMLDDAANQTSGQMPDAVLTDMQMPGVSGAELCRHIRSRQYPHQPLLIGMSASQPAEDRLQQLDAFVTKPIDPQVIQHLLAQREHLLAQRELLSPSYSQPAELQEISCLDYTVVAKLRKLMPAGALDELFTTYLGDTRQRLSRMEASAVTGDDAEVRRCAHMLKGSAAMTGASSISRIAARLEAGGIPLDEQRVMFYELRCTCDAIEGTLARDARNKEAHDY